MTILTIARRELRSMFASPIGWLVLAGFLFVNGAFFVLWVEWYAQASADFMTNAYASAQMTLAEHLFGSFFGNTAVIFVFIAPAISMRLFAEERRQQTMELLLTSPITTTEIVLGKYLGAVGFAGVLLAGTLYMPLLMMWWSTPDLASIASGYLAVWLVAAAVIAIGALFSAMTDNQITALVLTVATALVLYILGNMGDGGWMESIALLTHIDDLVVGAVRLSDLAYFAAIIGFFLFATHQRVESYRWA